MPSDYITDSERVQQIQSLSLQLDHRVAVSAQQREALDELLKHVLMLRVQIDRQPLKTRTAGAT